MLIRIGTQCEAQKNPGSIAMLRSLGLSSGELPVLEPGGSTEPEGGLHDCRFVYSPDFSRISTEN